MNSLIIGNLFSFSAAVCLAVSVTKKNKRSLIGWQTCDTVFCTISNFVLQSYAAMTISAICFIRNLLAYHGRLTKILTCVLVVLGCVIGGYVNNRGYIGWLAVAATAEYTLFMYITKNEQQMRYALIVNLLMWLGHDAYIQAYPMAFMDMALSVWTIYMAYKNSRFRRL